MPGDLSKYFCKICKFYSGRAATGKDSRYGFCGKHWIQVTEGNTCMAYEPRTESQEKPSTPDQPPPTSCSPLDELQSILDRFHKDLSDVIADARKEEQNPPDIFDMPPEKKQDLYFQRIAAKSALSGMWQIGRKAIEKRLMDL